MIKQQEKKLSAQPILMNNQNKFTYQQISTLIGIIMMKLGFGLVGSWGSTNLYFLSYFLQQGNHITPSTNSIMMLLAVGPLSIISLMATKISNCLGYEFTIRICCLLFLTLPICMQINFNIVTMTIFGYFFPAFGLMISAIPMLNCLYTQFPTVKNQMTAIVVVAFAIGGILWNLVFMLVVNPHNSEALIQKNQMKFFGPQIIQNLPIKTFWIYLSAGLLATIGSFMIKKRYQVQKNNQNTITSSQQITNIKSIVIIVKEQSKIIQNDSNTLVKSLKDRRFIYIMLISYLMSVYQVYVFLNLKIVYLPIIQDDHFIVYCAVAHTASSIVGAFIWGYIGDKKGIALSVIIIAMFDMVFKLYGNFARDKYSVLILFISLGLTDKGMVTLAGPGLVQIFGIQIGTQLLPYKGSTIVLGIMTVPIFQMLSAKIMAPFTFLTVLSLVSIITIVLSFRFAVILDKCNYRLLQDKQGSLQHIEQNPQIMEQIKSQHQTQTS